MIKTRLRYCVFDPDPNGNERYYVRKPGQKKLRIRERFEDENGNITKEFMAAYWAALASAPIVQTKALREETFDWLVDQYYRHEAFIELDKGTQDARRGILNRFCKAAGALPYKKFRREDVVRSRDKRKDTPAAADNFVKTLRRLFSWAISEGHAEINPAVSIKKIHKSDGWHTWTRDEIEQYRTHFPLGKRERLALELMLSIGARRSDAVRLGRQHEKDGGLRFKAWKNRKLDAPAIDVPILPEFAKALDQTKTGDLTYLITEKGLSYSIEGFGNVFRSWCTQAGLPHCSAHGLRKAAAVALAEHGATHAEMCAIFGWAKQEMADVYIKAAQKRKLADNAFGRLYERSENKSVSFLRPEKANETKRGKNRAKTT